jgi:hypothetical protein
MGWRRSNGLAEGRHQPFCYQLSEGYESLENVNLFTRPSIAGNSDPQATRPPNFNP